MNPNWRCLPIAIATAVCATSSIAESHPARLRHDPFARPDISANPATHGVPLPETVAKDWKPQLRAVVVAGKESMVNVGGAIVSLGGRIDGFQLTRVEERKALFVKDGVRVELTMDSDRTDRKESGR